MKTTQAILNDLASALIKEYSEQLNSLPIKNKVRETLKDGFTDGVRAGIRHTVAMLGVEVEKGE